MQDDKITPRNNWRRGKVEELILSKICGAVLRVYNKKKNSTFLFKRPVQNWFHLKLWTVLKRTIKMSRTLLLIVLNKMEQQLDNWSIEWITCKQVMAEECRILVVQKSNTWLSEYIFLDSCSVQNLLLW